MNIKKFLISAITGSVAWTLFLTPYMFLVVKNTWEQYVSWLGMQFILVPIIAPLVFIITEKVQNNISKPTILPNDFETLKIMYLDLEKAWKLAEKEVKDLKEQQNSTEQLEGSEQVRK